MNTVPSAKPARHLARTAASFIGLSIFNLFMVIPAMVYASLLASVYVTAFALYIGGVAVTASGLSGQNELALQGPLQHLMALTDSRFDSRQEEEDALNWRVSITSRGLQLYRDRPDTASADNSPEPDRNARIWDRAESLATGDLRITTDVDGGAQTAQTLVGLGLVFGGIGLCLVSIVLTRYTVIGLRRYVAMNASLLRGH
jgi:hypothetical protein